ncbi:hypothetical protein ACFWNR_24965 [Streptomyces virginiae]|uniref:hypothetical protein n=1 Tax=Streptomyces virginiae TaxID=1961 RepID=UPI00364E5E5B
MLEHPAEFGQAARIDAPGGAHGEVGGFVAVAEHLAAAGSGHPVGGVRFASERGSRGMPSGVQLGDVRPGAPPVLTAGLRSGT